MRKTVLLFVLVLVFSWADSFAQGQTGCTTFDTGTLENGPYKRSGIIIVDDVLGNVVLNERFNLEVKILGGDGRSNPAPSDKALLRLKPDTGVPGAQLLGGTQSELVRGTATFSGLAIDKPGEGYVIELLLGDGREAVAESEPFNVRPDRC